MRVLLAADGSKHGTEALRTGFRILSTEDASAEVMCVAPRLHPKRPGLQKSVERRAARIAEAVRKELARDGISAKPMVHTGSPASVLIRCAQSYDVTVASAQSRNNSVFGLGPVASRLLEHANSTVLLARPGDTGSPLKVLVPVDGSDAAHRALDKLAELVDLSSAEVTLLHVVETPWIRPVDDQEWFGTEEELDEEPVSELEHEFTLEAEGVIEEARRKLPECGTIETMIYHGIPAEDILTEANSGGYDLVVLAATGGQDLKHRMLGSVSSKVAWSAPCSVLMVHPGD